MCLEVKTKTQYILTVFSLFEKYKYSVSSTQFTPASIWVSHLLR